MPLFSVAYTSGVAAFAAETSEDSFFPGVESHRLSFALTTPRRFATRFIKETRTLQIRVIPAKAQEFDSSRFYDSRHIHRVVVEEKNSEVTLSLQLKNVPLAWLLVQKDDPWRLVFDIWRTQPAKRMDLESQWNWQELMAASTVSDAAREVSHPAPVEHSQVDVPKAAVEQSGANRNSLPTIDVLESKGPHKQKNANAFPENFGRLDLTAKATPEKVDELQKKAGSAIGSLEEYDASQKLAEELYKMGQEDKALVVFRRLAALSDRRFKDDPRIMWLAGESAYLMEKWDLASDYFRSLQYHHKKSPFTWLAQLRLNDIEHLSDSKVIDKAIVSAELASDYSRIALDETSPWQAKIAATLRVLHPVADSNPDASKLYIQNLNSCSLKNFVPTSLRRNCAYILTRYNIERLDVISADGEVQSFKQSYSEDPRGAKLQTQIENNVKAILEETAQKKNWDVWVALEKKARPGLLDFSLKHDMLVLARAEAWEAAGERKNASRLFSLFAQMTKDEAQRNEALALNARLQYKLNEGSKADANLKRIEDSDTRKTSGLSPRAVGAARELALAPYRSKRALNLVVDEIRAGRYVERELGALSQFATLLRRKPAADYIYEKILTFPAKSADETRTIENAIMQYADDLREAGTLPKSADMYFAVANLTQGTRRAEAAYKAGIVYARAGLLEKAKTSWQMAASDLNNKKYSSLANERLESIR